MKKIFKWFGSKGLILILMAAFLLAASPPPDVKAGDDKIKTHLFKSGDSTVSFETAPNTDCFLEGWDKSTGSGTDTLKVYVVDTWGNKTLAWLQRQNDTTLSSKFTVAQTWSNGVIILSTTAGSFWKVLYPYPSELLVVRSNASNLTDTSYVVIKAMVKPEGTLIHEAERNSFTQADKKLKANAFDVFSNRQWRLAPLYELRL